jgi:hypothetical protein
MAKEVLSSIYCYDDHSNLNVYDYDCLNPYIAKAGAKVIVD